MNTLKFRTAITYASCVAMIGLGLALPSAAQASIVAYEMIADAGVVGDLVADLSGLDADGLVRARGYLDPLSVPVVETDDATIIADNSVVNLGGLNSSDTSYVHHLDWLVPPANGSYLNATLYIAAVGLTSPTEVFVEGFSLGALSGILSTYAGLDVTLLGDDMLSVEIDKGAINLGFFGTFPNNVAILGSKLVVEYATPEPASVLVWSMIACLGLIAARKHVRT